MRGSPDALQPGHQIKWRHVIAVSAAQLVNRDMTVNKAVNRIQN
jgi:hypothetical protein